MGGELAAWLFVAALLAFWPAVAAALWLAGLPVTDGGWWLLAALVPVWLLSWGW